MIKGMYAGLYAPYYSFGGDLDGMKLLTDGNEFFYVPKVEPASGIGAQFGVRIKYYEAPANPVDVAFEASYAASRHDASWRGYMTKASYAEFSGAVKPIFRANKRLQPYAGAGFTFGWLTAENLSTDGTTVGSALYSMVAFNLQAGAMYFISDKLMVDLGLSWTLGSFVTAQGVLNEAKTIDNGLNPRMFVPGLKINYLF